MTPILKDYYITNLIKEMKIPTIIVTRSKVGTVNHTIMTVKMCEKYKIPIIAFVALIMLLFIPPNAAAFSCNTLQNKDIHCHVVGMTFFGMNCFRSVQWLFLNEFAKNNFFTAAAQR